jgi:hypothetical protein
MPSIHEFDVALNPGVTLPVSATRSMAREIHINHWQTGTKGSGQAGNIGTPAAATTGLLIGVARPSIGLLNCPTEIVLGDTKAAPGIMNLMEIAGNNIGAATNFNIIAIP